MSNIDGFVHNVTWLNYMDMMELDKLNLKMKTKCYCNCKIRKRKS